MLNYLSEVFNPYDPYESGQDRIGRQIQQQNQQSQLMDSLTQQRLNAYTRPADPNAPLKNQVLGSRAAQLEADRQTRLLDILGAMAPSANPPQEAPPPQAAQAQRPAVNPNVQEQVSRSPIPFVQGSVNGVQQAVPLAGRYSEYQGLMSSLGLDPNKPTLPEQVRTRSLDVSRQEFLNNPQNVASVNEANSRSTRNIAEAGKLDAEAASLGVDKQGKERVAADKEYRAQLEQIFGNYRTVADRIMADMMADVPEAVSRLRAQNFPVADAQNFETKEELLAYYSDVNRFEQWILENNPDLLFHGITPDNYHHVVEKLGMASPRVMKSIMTELEGMILEEGELNQENKEIVLGNMRSNGFPNLANLVQEYWTTQRDGAAGASASVGKRGR